MDLKSLIEVLRWPGAVTVIAIAGIIILKRPIGSLIARITHVGKGGFDVGDIQPVQPSDEKKGIEEFLRTFDNPLLVSTEEAILSDLKHRGIHSDSDCQRALVKSLAGTQIMLHFEQVYNLLWRQQLELLRTLNTRFELGISDIKTFYDRGSEEWPGPYSNHSFEDWLNFLVNANFIGLRDSKCFITVAGREFLKFLVAVGRADPFIG